MLDIGQSNLAIARTVAEPLLGPVGTGGVVLIFSIFILLARDDLRDRLVRLVGRNDLHRTIMAMNDAARRLSRYFLFQLALNSGFGALVGVSLWLAGLPNPLLWGILSGLMRFVPYIGVFIALAPPLLLAVAIVPGWSLAIVVLALFVGAELVMGQLVEPLIYGHSTGLSPLAVIVATAFWALLWGPIGLLIATPLTVCLVVIGRHVEALAFIDVILGDKPPLEPPETFYQRALEGHAVALVPAARRQIAASSLTDYYDTVALPGLALAQGDLMRDDLAFERLEGIHAQIESDAGPPFPGRPRATDPATPADACRRSGLDALDVVCIPGRGQLDDLAAAMAVQALAEAGFRARLEANMVLGASNPVDLTATRLCCLSILEEGSGVSGIRYFVRRIRKRMPDAVVVVGLWHASRDSPVLSALRSEGTDEHLVLSIGELLAFARTLSARRVRFRGSDAGDGRLIAGRASRSHDAERKRERRRRIAASSYPFGRGMSWQAFRTSVPAGSVALAPIPEVPVSAASRRRGRATAFPASILAAITVFRLFVKLDAAPFLLYLPAVILVSVAFGPAGRPLRDGALGGRGRQLLHRSRSGLGAVHAAGGRGRRIPDRLARDDGNLRRLAEGHARQRSQPDQPEPEPGDARGRQGGSRGGSRRGRGGEPLEERLPGQHEPRTAHALCRP